MYRIKLNPGQLWAMLRAMEILQNEPHKLGMTNAEAEEMKAFADEIYPHPVTGWITIRDTDSNHYKMWIRLFDELSGRAMDMFGGGNGDLGRRLKRNSEACRARFVELYNRKFLSE